MEASSKPVQEARGVTYEIRARGELDTSWSSRLRGMRITVEHHEHGAPSTLLHGVLPDDAALSGVLTTLYSLGLSLESVQIIRRAYIED